ncbi:MAG TPA: GNAT family N-acetyltransferase [Alphaproteobacteria bacterium]|nr:GNAT family N-acetyltransferase [Alphaproteobacteria bacterium]
MSILLREARPEDAAAVGRIIHEAFTAVAEGHGFLTDFPDADMPTGLMGQLVERDDVYVVVAESDGEVIGSNVLWENNPIAGVGPISVDTKTQGGAVGKKLMEDVLRRARERKFEGVRLVQTPFNCLTMALYTKLGFDVVEPLSVFQGTAIKQTIPGHAVRAATTADIEICDALCTRIHGHNRHGDLADAIQQGTATVVERDGCMTGYATVIGYFGHAVAETNDDLKALIAAAPEFGGPGFHVPSRNADLMRWCLSQGLRIMHPMTLMKMGPYREPAGPFVPSVIF